MTACIDFQPNFSLATMHRDIDFENRDSITIHRNNGTPPIVYDRASFMDRLLATEENNSIGPVYQFPSGVWICYDGDLSQLLAPYANFFIANINTIDGQMYGTLCCYTKEQIESSNTDPDLCLPVYESKPLPEDLARFESLPNYPIDGTIEEQDEFVEDCIRIARKEEGLLPLLKGYSSFPASHLNHGAVQQCLQIKYVVSPDKEIVLSVFLCYHTIYIHARDQVYNIRLVGKTTLGFLLDLINCKYSIIQDVTDKDDELDFSTYDTISALDARVKLLETELFDFDGASIILYTAEYLDAQP